MKQDPRCPAKQKADVSTAAAPSLSAADTSARRFLASINKFLFLSSFLIYALHVSTEVASQVCTQRCFERSFALVSVGTALAVMVYLKRKAAGKLKCSANLPCRVAGPCFHSATRLGEDAFWSKQRATLPLSSQETVQGVGAFL